MWAELPPAPGECTATEGPAQRCSGRCARCQVEMDAFRAKLLAVGEDEDSVQVMARRSPENHMDPCLRFPWDDVKELFDGATVTEAMLENSETNRMRNAPHAAHALRRWETRILCFRVFCAGQFIFY